MNADEPVGQLLCQINLVQRENDRHLLFAHQLLEHGQQFQLVANVEEGGGFIEHNDLRLLADSSCKKNPLSLAVTDGGKIPVLKIQCMNQFHCLMNLFPVFFSQNSQCSRIGITSCCHNILTCHKLRPDTFCHYNRQSFCHILSGHAAHHFTVQVYCPANQFQLPGHTF